jgi:hypothetical protein
VAFEHWCSSSSPTTAPDERSPSKGVLKMKLQQIAAMVTASASLFVVGVTLAENDRFSLNAPNGMAFSELRDYET